MKYIAFIFILIIIAAIYKYIANRYYLRRTRLLQGQFASYIDALNEKKADWTFVHNTSEVKELFLRAGLKDYKRTEMEFVGYGHVSPRYANWLDNLSANDSDFAQHTNQAFHQVEGIYEKRAKEAYNPIYWIERTIQVPARTLNYLGVPSDSIFPKLANIIGWLLAIIGIILSLPDFTDFRDSTSGMLRTIVDMFSSGPS